MLQIPHFRPGTTCSVENQCCTIDCFEDIVIRSRDRSFISYFLIIMPKPYVLLVVIFDCQYDYGELGFGGLGERQCVGVGGGGGEGGDCCCDNVSDV